MEKSEEVCARCWEESKYAATSCLHTLDARIRAEDRRTRLIEYYTHAVIQSYERTFTQKGIVYEIDRVVELATKFANAVIKATANP